MGSPPRPLQTVEHGMFVREVAPPGSAATLVFVHGLGESGLCFEHLLGHPGLAGLRLLVPDLPGYGRSVWPERPLGLDQQADHLARWLAARMVPGERVWIEGHSMGGVVGVSWAEREPAGIRGFVNVDGNVSPEDCVFSGRAVEWSLEDFEAEGFDRLRETVRRQGARERAQRGYYASMRLAFPAQFHLNSAELVAWSAPEDLARRMAALPIPVHYVAGVPRGASARTRELLARDGVPWTGLEPSGHWPFLDRPDEFVDLLARLVRDGAHLSA